MGRIPLALGLNAARMSGRWQARKNAEPRLQWFPTPSVTTTLFYSICGQAVQKGTDMKQRSRSPTSHPFPPNLKGSVSVPKAPERASLHILNEEKEILL